MASNPPGVCCTVGVKHEGETTGTIAKIDGTPTYFSYPKDKSTENAVLILTDVMGHEATNAQLIADQFAANGYFTVMPDLFQGDPVPTNRPEGFDVFAWLDGPPSKRPQVVDPVITKVIKEMRNNYNTKKVGIVGYCFGAKYVARFLGDIGSNNNAMGDAGFMAHPSLVDEAELSAITGPLSIAAAETDQIFPTEKRHKSEEILMTLSQGKLALPWEITLYSGVVHGFAVRGDPNDKRARFAKERAFLQAVKQLITKNRCSGIGPGSEQIGYELSFGPVSG